MYKILLKVKKHKTHDRYGPADVFLSEEGEELLEGYMEDLRPHTPYYFLTSDYSEPVFLTERGRGIKDFGSHIADVWSAKGYDQRFLLQHTCRFKPRSKQTESNMELIRQLIEEGLHNQITINHQKTSQ